MNSELTALVGSLTHGTEKWAYGVLSEYVQESSRLEAWVGRFRPASLGIARPAAELDVMLRAGLHVIQYHIGFEIGENSTTSNVLEGRSSKLGLHGGAVARADEATSRKHGQTSVGRWWRRMGPVSPRQVRSPAGCESFVPVEKNP